MYNGNTIGSQQVAGIRGSKKIIPSKSLNIPDKYQLLSNTTNTSIDMNGQTANIPVKLSNESVTLHYHDIYSDVDGLNSDSDSDSHIPSDKQVMGKNHKYIMQSSDVPFGWALVNSQGQPIKPSADDFTIDDSSHIHNIDIAPVYQGMTYKFNRNTGNLEFTGGKLTWASSTAGSDSDRVPFIGSYSDSDGSDTYIKPANIGFSDITSIQFDKGVNTSNISSNIECMFLNDYNLTNITGLSDWNTNNVTNMWRMFRSDSSLNPNVLNELTSWRFNSKPYTKAMVYSTKLNNGKYVGTKPDGIDGKYMLGITASNTPSNKHNVTPQHIAVYSDIYASSDGLANNVPKMNTQNRPSDSDLDKHWAFVDKNGIKSSTPIKDAKGNIMIAPDDDGLIYKYNQKNQSIEYTNGTYTSDVNYGGATNGLGALSEAQANSIKSVKYDDNINTSKLTNMSDMFDGWSDLQSVDFGNNFDASHVTTMSGMFSNDRSLKTINFGNDFDTSNVSDMNDICSDGSVQSIIFSPKFDTTKASKTTSVIDGRKGNVDVIFSGNINTAQMKSITIQSPKTKFGVNQIPELYKKTGQNDASGKPYTLGIANDFSKGNVGTFIRPANPAPLKHATNIIIFSDVANGQTSSDLDVLVPSAPTNSDSDIIANGYENQPYTVPSNLIPKGYHLASDGSQTFNITGNPSDAHHVHIVKNGTAQPTNNQITDKVVFKFVNNGGRDVEVGSTNVTGKRGSDFTIKANQLPANFKLINDGTETFKFGTYNSKVNHIHVVDVTDVVPVHPVQINDDTINYVIADTDNPKNNQVVASTKMTGSNNKVTVNSSNDANIPNGYHLVDSSDTFNLDGQTHSVKIIGDNKSADVDFSLSDGSMIPSDDDNGGLTTLNGHVGDKITPTIPKGYHAVSDVQPYSFSNNDSDNQSDSITIAGNQIKGTAHITLKYQVKGTDKVITSDVNIPINGHVGDSDITIHPYDYERNDYNDNNSDWVIPMNWKVAQNGNNLNYNLNHTFTYDANEAGNLTVYYVDMNHSYGQGGSNPNTRDVVGHQTFDASTMEQQGINWIVDNQIILNEQGTNDNGKQNTYALLVTPTGYHLIHANNDIQLHLQKQPLTLVLMLGASHKQASHHSNSLANATQSAIASADSSIATSYAQSADKSIANSYKTSVANSVANVDKGIQASYKNSISNSVAKSNATMAKSLADSTDNSIESSYQNSVDSSVAFANHSLASQDATSADNSIANSYSNSVKDSVANMNKDIASADASIANSYSNSIIKSVSAKDESIASSYANSANKSIANSYKNSIKNEVASLNQSIANSTASSADRVIAQREAKSVSNSVANMDKSIATSYATKADNSIKASLAKSASTVDSKAQVSNSSVASSVASSATNDINFMMPMISQATNDDNESKVVKNANVPEVIKPMIKHIQKRLQKQLPKVHNINHIKLTHEAKYNGMLIERIHVNKHYEFHHYVRLYKKVSLGHKVRTVHAKRLHVVRAFIIHGKHGKYVRLEVKFKKHTYFISGKALKHHVIRKHVHHFISHIINQLG